MIIDRVQHAGWLANCWLIAGHEEGPGIVVDLGADPPKVLEMIRRHAVKIQAILSTHRHYAHTAGMDFLARNLRAPVYTHVLEKPFTPAATHTLEEGFVFDFEGWSARIMHTPGHTAGQVALLVPGVGVWSGDSIFKGSVGSTVHPGSTGLPDLQRSVLERLLTLPSEMAIYPAHGEPTTVAQELEKNPFVRVWRETDPPGTRPARVDGRRVIVEVWARDFDGGHKAQVRYADGRCDIVAGNRVQRVTL